MLSPNRIKYLKSLHLKKYRQKYSHFLVEGNKIVNEFLKHNFELKELLLNKNEAREFREVDPSKITFVTAEILQKITAFKTRQDVIAVFSFKNNKLPIDFNQSILVLDGINDPSNLGALIRIAAWYNIKQIVCSEKVVDEYNPKTIAASMGNLSQTNIFRGNLLEILKGYPHTIYACTLKGRSIYTIKRDKKRAICLVIGSESHGISDELLAGLPIMMEITIPKLADVESLNAAVAAGIVIDRLIE